MKTLLRLPSPALVVAMLALFVAVGGTSYAVTALPRASVGTAQLKPDAVVSSRVRDGALKAVDLAPAEQAKVRGVTPWHLVGAAGEVPFNTTYSNTAPATDPTRFRREGDVVRLAGIAQTSQNGATWNGLPDRVVFTLPPGFRPAGQNVFVSVVGQQTTEPGNLLVQDDGDVVLLGSTSGFVALDGVTVTTS